MRRVRWVGVTMGWLLACAGVLVACSGDTQHGPQASAGSSASAGALATGGNRAMAGSSSGLGGSASGASGSTDWGPQPDPMLGAEPSWPALTLEQFREQFAAARCKQLAGCCSSFDQATCVTRAYADWYAARSLVEGPFDATVGAACLAQIQGATCAERDYPHCKEVFSPHVERGAACKLFDRCQPSPAGEVLCLNDVCTLLWRRDEGQSCAGDCKIEADDFNYTCGYRTDNGPQLQVPFCDLNQHLSCDHWQCRPISGEPCYDGQYCAVDEFCKDKASGCVPMPKVGQACDYYCFESLCSADKRCVPLFALGEQCYSPFACQSGYCQTDDTCGEPSAEYCSLGQ